MSLSGTVPNLDVKYTESERQKFYKLVVANSDGNKSLMAELISRLDLAERARFKEYFADLKVVQEHQKSLQDQATQHKLDYTKHMQKATQIDTQIDHLKQQRTLNFQHGVKGAVASHKQADLSATPKLKVKKSACTIM